MILTDRDRWELAYTNLFAVNEQLIAQLELYERAIAMYERKVVEQSAEIERLRAVIRRSTTPDRSIDTAPWDEQ
jgi:hypothetical protein